MRLPDGDGLAVLKPHRRELRQHAGGGDHRLRLDRERGGGAEGGRLRLPREADQGRAAAPARGERAEAPAPGAGAARVDRRDVAPGMPRLLGESPAIVRAREMISQARALAGAGVHHGRVGHRARKWPRASCTSAPRAPTRTFVAVNCGAIPENLMESEFFGYKRGAFTGADNDKHRLPAGGAEGHALPRRGGRPAARDAGEAAARDPGEEGAARGRHAGGAASTCASSRPRTATSPSRWTRANSARTSSIG